MRTNSTFLAERSAGGYICKGFASFGAYFFEKTVTCSQRLTSSKDQVLLSTDLVSVLEHLQEKWHVYQ